ncbi:hypothetical protein ABBQ32_006851 [Trebouxia sp. C0010 RCD-2024]
MLWAQRVSSSVHLICTPTAVCGRFSAARFPPQRFLSCPAFRQGACTPAAQKGVFCGYRVVGGHRVGQLNMLRGDSEQNSDNSAQDYSAADSEDPDQASYRVVNFYHLIDIQNPYQVIAEHKHWVQDKDLAGRIYLSTQGINAQYSGLTAHAEGYAMWLQEQEQFKGLRWSSFPVHSHQFPKLRLKFKQNLISLAGGMTRLPVTDPTARAASLAPSQWRQMLAGAQHITPAQVNGCGPQRLEDTQSRPDSAAESSGSSVDLHATAVAARPDVVVLDVRNDYEWDAGHFQGANRPQEENFNETPTEASSSASIPSYLQGKPADTPVMMYCTGGIRCDVYSAHLRDKGFTNLYTLEGGIQNYLMQEGHDMWDGSLFVFDGRMAVPSGDPGHEGRLVAAAPCANCGQAASLPHMNCANIDCNKLFLACDHHKEEFAGCCSEECLEAPRLLRPPKQAGYYGNWTTYSSDDEVKMSSMVEGRGNGRLARRQKRLEKLRSKEAAARAERQARKELVKAALLSRQNSQDSDHGKGEDQDQHVQADAAAQRMARLRLLQHQHRARSQLTSV